MAPWLAARRDHNCHVTRKMRTTGPTKICGMYQPSVDPCSPTIFAFRSKPPPLWLSGENHEPRKWRTDLQFASADCRARRFFCIRNAVARGWHTPYSKNTPNPNPSENRCDRAMWSAAALFTLSLEGLPLFPSAGARERTWATEAGETHSCGGTIQLHDFRIIAGINEGAPGGRRCSRR